MTIVMRELRTFLPWQSPFNPDVPGFTNHWWQRDWGQSQSVKMHFYDFLYLDQEVARAEVLVPPHRLESRYIGLGSPCLAVEILLFEVRADRRREGIGRKAVQRIIEAYPGELLFAFSEKADHFWSGIGWKHYRRDDEGCFRLPPLFVFDQRT